MAKPKPAPKPAEKPKPVPQRDGMGKRIERIAKSMV